MRSKLLVAAALLNVINACTNPKSNSCASAFSANLASASAFCATFTTAVVTATTALPDVFASACSYKPSKISSECACYVTGAATSTTTVKTTATSASKTTISTSTTGVITTATATTTGSYDCTVTAFASISSAVKSCTNILLSDVSAPASSTMKLALQTGASLTFAGNTTFGTTVDSDFDPIVLSGTDITVTGAPGHIIDGNGPAYWDGEGSNGGSDKPDHFFVVKKVRNAIIENLNIKNWPTHCFYISNAIGLTMNGLTLDNSAGDEPNDLSDGAPAAHNSDGFDISGSDTVTLSNIKVLNQDDCVAVTSGSNILVTGMYCSGGHGLSIGSIGGKSNNTVVGVTFSNSQIVDSQNGCRIKTNYDTTGTVANVTYDGITMSGISDYGIDIQQDYLNGGPTGDPSNGVLISGITFINVTGTVDSDAYDYYILCGDGSCSDFTFEDVDITGGLSSCNYPSSLCLE
ncbi:putative endopolygalacturonase D [Cytospora mali]|uniref:endo-polygalacturonase n=1 Tax=Cytospora mali TaxID=578113 RepID=A0A194VBR6_CYTMA|nr:putative endopolygalacturonase D [Valsa mali var. pyri (nom. inval.)]